MATKNAALRNGQADYLGAQFDGGALELLDSTDAVLATITLATPAFGAAASGQISAAGVPISFTGTAAAGTGTDVTSATMTSSDDTQQLTDLTVGTSSAHIVLDNTNIAEGQNGNFNSFSLTVPETIQNP